MNKFGAPLASMLGALLLNGCVSPPVRQPDPPDLGFIETKRAAANHQDIDLDVCVFPSESGHGIRDYKKTFLGHHAQFRIPPFRSMSDVASMDDTKGCDISLRIWDQSGERYVGINQWTGARIIEPFVNTFADVYSSHSKRKLVTLESRPGASAIGQLYMAFKKGAPLYETVIAQRPASNGPAVASLAKEAPVRRIQSDVDAPRYALPERVNAFALIIGVEKYKGLPEARFADRDAAAMRAHLSALGYPERNIKYLAGMDATKTGIEKYVETWLPRVAKEGSQIFLYFSGHGAPNPETGQAFLVPWDGDPQYLENTAYPVKRLYEKLNALKSKSVIVVVDSCFSGSGGRSVLAKGTRPLVGKVDVGDIGRGKVVALTASAGNQISGSLEEQGHGLFTYYFLKGLNGAAADGSGKITVKGLYSYIRPFVEDEANRENRNQTPQLMPETSESITLR